MSVFVGPLWRNSLKAAFTRWRPPGSRAGWISCCQWFVSEVGGEGLDPPHVLGALLHFGVAHACFPMAS